jgi:hypothetical protein
MNNLCLNCRFHNADDNESNCALNNHIETLCTLEDLVLFVIKCKHYEPYLD